MKSSKASSLPSELLFIIALLAYPRNIPCDILDAYSPHGLSRLSQVCRHWRNELLSYPKLWSNIEIFFPSLKKIPLVNTMLSRSADCLLQVTFMVHVNDEELEPDALRCYDLVFAHILRIERFTIGGNWSQNGALLDHIFSLFAKPAPNLKVVRFLQDSYPTPPFKLVPEGFLCQFAPKLEELRFSHLEVSYQMSVLKSITRLSFRNVVGMTSMAHLLDVLAATSDNLSLLDLQNLLGVDLGELSGRFVQLSSLQSLTLKLDPVLLIFLLDRMKVPSDINWKIHCFDAVVTLSLDVTPLFRFLKQARTRTFLKLTLEYDADTVTMEFGDDIDAIFNASLTMYLFTWSNPQGSVNRVHELFASLNLSKVDDCHIIATDGIPEWLYAYIETFGSLFFFFDGLQDLCIFGNRGEFGPRTSNALLPLIAQLLPAQTLPCPLLGDLTLEPVPTKDKSWIQVLQERKAAGNNLMYIQVAGEPHDPGLGEELKMLAKKVII